MKQCSNLFVYLVNLNAHTQSLLSHTFFALVGEICKRVHVLVSSQAQVQRCFPLENCEFLCNY